MRVAACILNESSVHRDSDLAVYTNNNVRHFPLVMNHFDAHFSIFWHVENSTLQRNYITIFNYLPYTEYTFDVSRNVRLAR